MCKKDATITLNPGELVANNPVNIVGDACFFRLNARARSTKAQEEIDLWIHKKLTEIASKRGIELIVKRDSNRPPKEFDQKTRHLSKLVTNCANKIDLKIDWVETGGASDGNIISSLGIPCIDTMGIEGGNMHTNTEFAKLESIVPRAMLTALTLMELAKEKQ